MKDFPHFIKRITLTLIRKVFYELPAIILILDTRLLLKHELKPPWEGLYTSSKGYMKTLLFSSNTVLQKPRMKDKKWICIALCFVIPMPFVAMRLVNSKEEPLRGINHDNIANTIVEDGHLRTRIRQRLDHNNILSFIHLVHSANTHLFEQVEHLYRKEIQDKFTSYIASLQGESFDNNYHVGFIHNAVKSVSDHLDYSKRHKNISTSALSSIGNIEGRFSIMSKKLESCLNQTESKIHQLELFLNFFQNEEMYLLAQDHFIHKDEHNSYIDNVYNNLLGAMTAANSSTMTIEDVHEITNKLIRVYDSDKTGKFDFALESAGGSILTTRCTESLINYKALYTIFGFNVWYPSHNPRLAIQHGAHPGECWSFKGSRGSLVIKLSNLIFPKEISIEHIPKFLTPSWVIDSAPKNFQVLGLASENDETPLLLGNYSFLDNGLSLQSFQVQFPPIQPFSILEVVIHSNHGHPNYTCLYRVRAHGVLFL